MRMDADGSEKRGLCSIGHRNPVGMDFHPVTGELWSNDNQVDGMGDDTPPGELNRITGPGQHFGFPWYGGGKVRTTSTRTWSRHRTPCCRWSRQAACRRPRHGVLHRQTSSRPNTRTGVFTAQHGSWNRTEPVGARVLFTPLNEDGTRRASRRSSPWAG